MHQDILEKQSIKMFAAEILPKIYPGAQSLIASDRANGFRLVLVSGGLDFAITPAADYLGFDDLIANRLAMRNGIATGETVAPLLAGREKVAAIENYCREYNVDTERSKAYSDSLSDVPMLEALGSAVAVNPDRHLRKIAIKKKWLILDLRVSK